MRIGILYIRSGPSTEEEFEGWFCERSKQTMSLGEEGVFSVWIFSRKKFSSLQRHLD